jgi:quinol monooxygenase YgiN
VRAAEAAAGDGALHRWLLRCVRSDGRGVGDAVAGNAAGVGMYAALETFAGKHGPGRADRERRWLSGVETLASAGETATLMYDNLYTTKLHLAVFDVNAAVVVMEGVSAADTATADAMEGVLRGVAECAVASGCCLEYCVLRSRANPTLFKTIEVYADAGKLERHIGSRVDRQFVRQTEPLRSTTARSRVAFKPVVFS